MIKGFSSLALLVRENREAKKFFYKFIRLALLSADKIEEGFDLLKNEIKNNEFDDTFAPFVAYFQKQWMQVVRLNFFLKCFRILCVFLHITISGSNKSLNWHEYRRFKNEYKKNDSNEEI